MKKGIVRVLCGLMVTQIAFSHAAVNVKAENVGDQALEESSPIEDLNEAGETEDSINVGDQEEPDLMQGSDSVSEEDKEEDTEKDTEEDPKNDQESVDVSSDFTVNLLHKSSRNGQQDFQVYLENTSFIEYASLNPEQNITEKSVKFDHLDEGTYVLCMESAGFVSYRQEITIENGYNYSVTVATGNVGIDASGVMPYGDLQKDGVVDAKDTVAVVDALESESSDLLYDINEDGNVNLLDLEKAVALFNGEGEYGTMKEAAVNKNVIPGLIQASVPETTRQQGSVEDLLAGKDSLSLSPADQDAVISAETPVEISFDFMENEKEVQLGGIVLQTPSENRIDSGLIEITYTENGQEQVGLVVIGQMRMRSSANVIGTAEVASNGQLAIKLNGQIAVKKVTITITSMTQKDATLAEITSVEFVNDMENYIPAPTLDIPEVLRVEAGNKSIQVAWKKVTNVTGYQVLVSLDGYTEYVNTTDTSLEITKFRNKSLENKKTYTIAVRSVNGEWNSGYEQTYQATPKYDTIPDAPDSLKLTSDYRIIHASWAAPKDNAADSYTLYYKKQGDNEFKSIDKISSTNYTLYDLEEEGEYVIYVTAVNEHGEGPASLQASIKTKSIKPVQFSQYRIINSASKEGELTDHIVNITRRAGTYVNGSNLDGNSNTSALAVADNNFQSYYQINDWDDAVAYHTGNEGWGLTVELDQAYKMNRFAIAAPDDSTYYTNAAVYYWKDGARKKAEGMSFQRKTDENGRAYYEITLSAPIETNKVQFGLQVSYYSTHRIQVSEIRLYEYDSLADDIRALYTDDLYIALRDNVTEDDFVQLQERIDTKINGDYHPEREALQKELDAAKQLFEEQKSLDDIININTGISASYDSGLKLSGLNAWQPLGITAMAGDEIVIYVGAENGKQGNKSNLQLVVTQQHGEYDQFAKTMNLNVGRNVITVPEIVSTDVEKGGALYIQYTGNNKNDRYAVRVNGGAKIPVLNLYGVTDETERQRLIGEYVKELTEYCKVLEDKHEEDHSKKFLFFSLNSYDEKTCIYNTTDIMLDHMMISVPATQILAGLGSEQNTEKMTYTVDAMDAMMELFYQHKGLAENFEEETAAAVVQKNHIPVQHLNIRYMKMFSGAFMYAGGNHIGIEWGSVKELVLNEKPVIDENGKLTEGSYFGWGIAHEIGHQINQGDYAIAEVTNNYFAVLAQADGTNESVRFSYDDVYDKVTSNTTGYPSNVFTQLGMYWQLHLAYDSDYAQKTYENYEDIFNNLLFARVDTYARNPEVFNSAGWEVSLQLSGNTDQNLMRLVSAATKKNLTDFFGRWGYVPDEETTRFMNQFEEESRAIYYINDDVKTADIEGRAASLKDQRVVENVEVSVDHSDVTLNITADEQYSDQIMGYEIIRVTTRKGTVEKEVVGFTTEDTFTDSVTLGSRAVSYEVYAVDLLTNRAEAVTTDAIKIISDGNYEKTQFLAKTNMTSELDHQGEATEQDPCEPDEEPAVNMVLDGNKTEQYLGKAEKDPYVLIDLKQTLEVSALRYYASSNEITDYSIEVSTDGNEYIEVAVGTFQMENGQDTIYFTNGNDPWVTTYDIRYIKVTAKGQAGQEIGITEFDILGPSGDNIEFTNDQGKVTIGKLAADYIYDKENNQKIPEGSIVFAGSYKGNPAYNVVVLYDQDGNIVGGTNDEGELIAQQIILAPDPGNALLGEVSEGIWIYWIEPDQQFTQPKQVKAELYRVDNALTNEGERLTSDTVYQDVPDQMEEIQIEE